MTSSENTKLIAPPLNIGGFDIPVESVKDALLYINHNTGYDMVDRHLYVRLLQQSKMDYQESISMAIGCVEAVKV